MRQIVARSMIVGMQTETGNRVRDNSFPGQHVIVRPLKEMFVRMRVCYQPRAVPGKFWPEIRTLVSRQPERVWRYGRVGPRDHLEFEIGYKRFDWHRRMLLKISRAVSANLFTAKQRKHNRALGLCTSRERLSQFQNCGYSRRIVICAVENIVAGQIRADAEMIQVCRQ